MIGRGGRLGRALVACVALASGEASALAANGFDAQNWKPALDPYGYVTVEGARSLRSLQPHVALYFDWAHNPLEFAEPRPGGFGRDVIRDLAQLDLVAGIGLLSIGKHAGLEIGADLPIVLDENGLRVGFDPVTGKPDGLEETGFGNLRTAVKLTALDREDDPIGIAARIELQWPTGRESDFLSNDGHVTPVFGLIVEKKLGPVRFGIQCQYEHIPGHIEVAGVTVDDKVKLGAGLALEPFDQTKLPLGFVLEAFHWFRACNPWKAEAEAPVEIGAAVKYGGTLFAALGVNFGLNKGVGSPDERLFAALGIAF